LVDAVLRRRVERLLHGDFIPEDFTTLFLSLRFQSNGMQTVSELGNFVAHPDERERGISTDMAKTFFRLLRFQTFIYDTGGNINLSDMPVDVLMYMQETIKTIDNKLLWKRTRLKQKEAKRVAECLPAKFSIANKRASQIKRLDTKETVLMHYLLTAPFTIAPAFDDVRLFNEFAHALIKNGLLNTIELDALRRKSPALSLFAMIKMHRCNIIIEDGDKADLSIGVQGEYMLCVNARARTPTKMIPNLYMEAPIFKTYLSAEMWCEDRVLQALKTNPSQIPEMSLELTRLEKLSMI